MSFTEYSTSELRRKFSKNLPFGLEKLRVIREDRMAYCERKVKGIDHSFSSDTIRATFGGHEKEKDWAILGGLSSGIGGVGAGVATAVNAQMENAEIRKRNAERDANAERIVQLSRGLSGQLSSKYISEIQLMVSTERKERSLLIGISKSTKELASYLQIDILNGSSVRVRSSYKDARIDGYLKIYVDGEGSYILPLPYYGVEETQIVNNQYLNHSLTLVETRDTWKNKIISVEPVVLWTIEEEATQENCTARTLDDIKASPYYQRFENDWLNLPSSTTASAMSFQDFSVCLGAFILITTILTGIIAIIVLIANESASIEEALLIPFLISAVIGLITAIVMAKKV